ncbi:MAG: TPM domain-containing protein [Oscillospiraceae bacterium]
MKKLFSIVISLCAAVMMTAVSAVTVSAYSAGIDDRAGLYSSSELKELEKRQEEVSELTGWNIAVITTNTGFGADGIAACDYAERYYDETFGADSSSVVYLIDLDYRWIAMDGDVLSYFNSSRFDTMMDKCEYYYQDYQDVKNLETFYYYLEYYYGKGTVGYDSNIGAKGDDFESSIEYYGSSPKNFSFDVFIAFLVTGAVIAAISIAVVVSRYKFHYAPTANCYLNSNTINYYRRNDIFVREFTSRTRISDSSGGGSHHSGGSRRSGGRSHGGGGRGGRR